MPETLRWAFLVMCLVGCGGGAAARSQRSAPVTAAAVQGDPTDGGRRRASDGARCDYGGAAELTCHRGLYCCYGPPSNPGAFGQCMAECPQY